MLNLLEAFSVKACLAISIEKQIGQSRDRVTEWMFFHDAEAQEQQLIIEQQAQSHGFD